MTSAAERIYITDPTTRCNTADGANALGGGGRWNVPVHTTYACDPWVIGRRVEVGDYLNHHGYSDSRPYRIVRLSPSGKTAYVREVEAERDPDWKPEIEPGGFVGHCTNNREQRWVYGELIGEEIAVRLTKQGWKSKRGNHSASAEPFRFYDYNF